MDPLTTDTFRRRLGEDIQRFHTRHAFDPPTWDDLVARFHYQPAAFDDLGAFQAHKAEVARLDARHGCGGNAGGGSSWRSPSAPTWPPPGG